MRSHPVRVASNLQGSRYFSGQRICALCLDIYIPSLFFPSHLWSANFKAKHVLNLSPNKYLLPCTGSPKGFLCERRSEGLRTTPRQNRLRNLACAHFALPCISRRQSASSSARPPELPRGLSTMAPTALNNYKAKYFRNARNFKPDDGSGAAAADTAAAGRPPALIDGRRTARPNLWTAARGGERRRRRRQRWRLPRRDLEIGEIIPPQAEGRTDKLNRRKKCSAGRISQPASSLTHHVDRYSVTFTTRNRSTPMRRKNGMW